MQPQLTETYDLQAFLDENRTAILDPDCCHPTAIFNTVFDKWHFCNLSSESDAPFHLEDDDREALKELMISCLERIMAIGGETITPDMVKDVLTRGKILAEEMWTERLYSDHARAVHGRLLLTFSGLMHEYAWNRTIEGDPQMRKELTSMTDRLAETIRHHEAYCPDPVAQPIDCFETLQTLEIGKGDPVSLFHVAFSHWENAELTSLTDCSRYLSKEDRRAFKTGMIDQLARMKDTAATGIIVPDLVEKGLFLIRAEILKDLGLKESVMLHRELVTSYWLYVRSLLDKTTPDEASRAYLTELLSELKTELNKPPLLPDAVRTGSDMSSTATAFRNTVRDVFTALRRLELFDLPSGQPDIPDAFDVNILIHELRAMDMEAELKDGALVIESDRYRTVMTARSDDVETYWLTGS